MAPHHLAMWRWVFALEAGRPPAYHEVDILPRGGMKSTNAEASCVAVGERKSRNFVLYVSSTEAKAREHVQTIGTMLGSPEIQAAFPDLADRELTQWGYQRAWRQDRIMTKAGLIVSALSLEQAVRGIRIDEYRPDYIILDDIDEKGDGPAQLETKLQLLTSDILPAGASDMAVLAVQNLIHPDSIFSQLHDGRAQFLARRQVRGPIPALEGFDWEWQEQEDGTRLPVILRGTPTWSGQSREVCQHLIETIGPDAFRAECQHEVEAGQGSMWDDITYRRMTYSEYINEVHPNVVRTVVTIDPAVTKTDHSDAHGVSVQSLDRNGFIYKLYSWEKRATPLEAMKEAIYRAIIFRAERVLVETNQGGDVWGPLYREAGRKLMEERGFVNLPPGRQVKVSGSEETKAGRAQEQVLDYQMGRIIHVEGPHKVLESSQRRFGVRKPYDLVDADTHGWRELRGRTSKTEYTPLEIETEPGPTRWLESRRRRRH